MVRIPRSARHRKILTWARLLRRVAPYPLTGLDFEGELLWPGEWVPLEKLWPSPAYPRQPILMEGAGAVRSGWGKNRAPELYILWRYEVKSGEWIELARCEAQGWEWPAILGQAARAAVAEQLPIRPPAEASAVAERLRHLLDEELAAAAPADRWKVLAMIHEQLAGCAAELRSEHALSAAAWLSSARAA